MHHILLYHFVASAALIFLVLGQSLAQGIPQDTKKDKRLHTLAEKLAHKYIIVDGHVDLPYRLRVKNFKFVREFIGIPIETRDGDFDYVRAKRGGLTAPFMSIYTPSSYQQKGGAKQYADSVIDLVMGIPKAYPDKYALATSPAEIERNFKRGMISLPLGMENGAPIENDLSNVAYFHKRGVRYITLTHGTDNLICDSSYDTTQTWKGLSPFGAEVVREMNRVGIMVDVSHVSDSAFYQVLRVSKAPVIASHSSCRFFTPTFLRNMSDDMIQALAKKGGVIHINFSTYFLDDTKRKAMEQSGEELNALLKSKGLKGQDSAAKPIIADFEREHPLLFSDVEEVANHIDHVVKLVGVDYVGFGSDFDGVGNSLPTGLKDVSQYPNLIYVLLKRGYSEKDIAKICYQNTFRVWREVEKVAKEMQTKHQ
ncbi:MAG: dipeptidase [Candidatus Kapabacteria bacterium]|nr:dipeptidase [Candidatus Kapabacteria bacterium]